MPSARPRFRHLSLCLWLVIIGSVFLTSRLQAQNWVSTARLGNEVRFLFAGEVRRYDLSTRTWLPTVTLPRGGATAIAWEGQNCYIAYGTALYSYTASLTGEAPFGTVTDSTHGLYLDGNLVIAVHSSGLYARVTIFHRTSRAILSTMESYVDSLYGSSHAPGINRLFGRTSGISPSDIVYGEYTDAGLISDTIGSPYHGTYPGASRTWVSGDELRVVDSSGTVYTTSTLTYVGSLGGTVTDMVFNGDVLLVLRTGTLIAFKNTLGEAGRKTLASSAGTELQIDATSAYVFRPGTAAAPQPLVEIVPLTDVNMPEPFEPMDATGLAFTPHTVFKDRDGLICLYSQNLQAVFRWSPQTEGYVLPLMLTTAPARLAYSSAHHRLYMAHDQNVRRMDAVPGAATTPFVTAVDRVYGLTAVGDFIYASSERNTKCYSSTGTPLPGSNPYGGVDTVWDPVKRRVYHYTDAYSPADLMYEPIAPDGRIGTYGTWSLSINYSRTLPVRVSPDGNAIVAGDGVVFNANNTNSHLADLNVTLKDMDWFNGVFVSLETNTSTTTKLQRWSSNWARQQSVLLDGAPLRVLPLSADQLLVITMHNNVPRFHILDSEYQVVYDSITGPPVILAHPLAGEVDFRTNVELRVIAAGSPPLQYQWFKDNTPVPGATAGTLTLTNVGSGDAGEYKVRVTNPFGTLMSDSTLLFVGPVHPSPFTAGNLLVSSGRRINEYTTAGVLRNAVNVPLPTPDSSSSRVVADVVADRFGRIHVLNEGVVAGNTRYFISSFDPRRQLWWHRPLADVGFLSDSSGRDLTISGDWIYHRLARYNISNGASELITLPATVATNELTLGLDGKFYGGSGNGEVNRLNPDLTVAAEYQLGSGIDIRGIVADDSGEFFTSEWNNRLSAWSAGGALIKTLTPAGTFSGFFDISLSPEGRIAAGSSNGRVALTDTSLNAATTINPNLSSSSYTAWFPQVPVPAPSLANTPGPPPATEDVLWQWAPAFEHPDPDAVVTYTLPMRPPWLNVSGNILSGTPLNVHAGPNTVRIRATDGSGNAVDREFIIQVAAVNDTPVALDHSVAVDEDAAPVVIDLTALFSDEETSPAALAWQILTSSGAAVVPALQDGDLRLTFPANASGDASVTVRATDAGGLTADSLISITVRPVNDPPAFPAVFPDINAGAAAADASVDLRALMTDPDAGDTHTWRLVSVSNADIFSSLAVDADGRLVIRYAPYRSGSADVTVEVKDAAGTAATLAFKIVLPELPAPVVATSSNLSLTLNRQTGLWEQRITLRNDAARALGGFEVKISNLPAGVILYNGSGEVSAVHTAGYYSPIAPGESVTMVLEYHNPARGAFDPDIQIVTALPQTPPPAGSGGLAIDRVATVPGGLLLEFTAIPGHLYIVQYSDDGITWWDSRVRIRAAGNRVQWLDQGPPRTSSPPSSTPQRFYRVKEVPDP